MRTQGHDALLDYLAASSGVALAKLLAHDRERCKFRKPVSARWLRMIAEGRGEPDVHLALALARRASVPIDSWDKASTRTRAERKDPSAAIEDNKETG